MEEQSYEPIDDLFRQIRLQLLRVREIDPATAEELKALLTQLEDWVEKLVIDSLKLRSLEKKPKKAPQSANSHRKTTSSKKRTPTEAPQKSKQKLT